MKTLFSSMSPEDMLADQLLINAGSHETQAILVLALEPDTSHEPEEMVAAIDALLPAGISSWPSDEQRPIAGLLSSIAKGRLTKRGATQGKAMAAAALSLADEQNVSLGTLWGPVPTGEAIRGPFGRFLLMRQLLEQGTDQTPVMLERSLPITRRSIQSFLSSVAASNLIQYDVELASASATPSFTPEHRALWKAAVESVSNVVQASPDEQKRLIGQGKDFLTDQSAMIRTLQRMRASARSTSTG